MAKINLLPWRDEQRKERQREFFLLLIFSAVAAIGLVFVVLTYLGGTLSVQNDRNAYLQAQIKDMDKQIEEIAELEKTREALFARKQVIEDLQSKRSLTVQLLNELVTTTPVGVTVTNLRQLGLEVTISGTAQSNARVSEFLTQLGGSQLLVDPELAIIEANEKRAQAVEPYDFRIRVRLKLASESGSEGFDEEQSDAE
ncbi:MAG: PilN domain-containing protein [Xanthomonadales bacterium]|nr:PilN domain-containing protein [Xanthomonadales bacterium]